MGRVQGFDTVDVVRAARDLFWDRGYDAVSLPELERATGLGRSSIYHAFESKRGLFDAAVQNYLDTVIRPRIRVLVQEPIAPDALHRYFEGLGDAIARLPDDSPRRGCLLLNSAAGLASHDEGMRAVVDDYRVEFAAATAGALLARFPLLDDGEIAVRSRLLTSLSTSALIMARVNREEAVAIVATATGQIDAWVSGISPVPRSTG